MGKDKRKEVISEPTPSAKQPVVEEKVPVVEPPKEVEANAIIDGVEMALNIRKDPEVKANNQIAILSKGTKIIVIDPDKPIKNKDGEWYKIRIFDKTHKAEDGFAMKKYIKII